MKFIFVSEPTFELWDFTNPDRQGIGGSETSHIEMARRLALRGHEVHSYAPTPFRGPVDGPGGVMWKRFDQIDWNEHCDIWVIYRAPRLADHLPEGATAWLICQDVDYSREGAALTSERAAKFARIVALCETHGEYLRFAHKEAADSVVVSSNGIKAERIRELLANPPERNPHRLMYASSPDRGMEYLLQVFPKAKEHVPDLELHIYYGFDNIEKVIEHMGKGSVVDLKTARLRALLEQPGVHYHGRMGQMELLGEWFKSGIWCHPSNFTETSCITCMDAQACGAIPITGPVWAIAENVKHGVFIQGNVTHELVQARYGLELFRMAVQPELQDEIRADMMPWALDAFDWEVWVGQWQGWARADVKLARRRRKTEIPVRMVPRFVPDVQYEGPIEAA